MAPVLLNSRASIDLSANLGSLATPLRFTVLHNQLLMFKLLLSGGAGVAVDDLDGTTALCFAAEENNGATSQELIG